MISKVTGITLKFITKYLTSLGENKLNNKTKNMKCLIDIFAEYGGILGKISQMLCLENGAEYVFSECKPYSKDKTILYFKNIVSENKNGFFDNITDIDYNVFKSGSIGQIHKAIFNHKGEKQDIVIKIKYVGIYKQFKEDVNVLKIISKFLYNVFEKHTETEIINKLYEELDYNLEFNNQKLMSNIWNKTKDIYIPKVIKELSTDSILTSEFIEAEDFFSFVENSTQNQRNHIGMLIFEFIYRSFLEHGLFYSDVHYGNFLIKNKKKLIIVDFGCINKISKKLINNIKNLQLSILKNDKEFFFKVVKNMGVYNENISNKSKEYMWQYFKLQLKPLINNHFHFSEDYLDKITNKDLDLMKEWVLPKDCAYLNKLNYGFPHILTKLNLKANTFDIFNSIIKKIV